MLVGIDMTRWDQLSHHSNDLTTSHKRRPKIEHDLGCKRINHEAATALNENIPLRLCLLRQYLYC